MVANSTLAIVDDERLQRAVEGLTAGTYTITLTRQTEVAISASTEVAISASVGNGDGKTYSVTLAEGKAFCGCGNSMFRGKVCKHATALALYAIRTLQSDVTPPPLNLKLARV